MESPQIKDVILVNFVFDYRNIGLPMGESRCNNGHDKNMIHVFERQEAHILIPQTQTAIDYMEAHFGKPLSKYGYIFCDNCIRMIAARVIMGARVIRPEEYEDHQKFVATLLGLKPE